MPLATTVSTLPGMTGVNSTDEIIPFATAFHEGLLYIGTVTNGEDGGSLRAYVHTYDPDNGNLALVLDFDLTYNRGAGFYYTYNTPAVYAGPADWNAWTTTNAFPAGLHSEGAEIYYPQPIFADIEFDTDNNMLIGLRDRFGDQGGDYTPPPDNSGNLWTSDGFGDILRATPAGAGWTINIADFTDNTYNPPIGDTENIFGMDSPRSQLLCSRRNQYGRFGVCCKCRTSREYHS